MLTNKRIKKKSVSRRRRKRSVFRKPRRIKRHYKYLYSKMLDRKIILNAWNNLRIGKTKRKVVKIIDSNLDVEIENMRTMILNTKPECYTVEHPDLAYNPPKNRKSIKINERGKERIAYLADIREQWYFHIIVEVLKPIVMKKLYKHSCGSIPRRGPHTGKRHIEKAIKKNKGVDYFLKFDIRHFYDNLRIDIVIRELRNDIADELFLYCIMLIYKYNKKGIMIGLYISPWLANYVLIDLDNLILLKSGVSIMVRYMDDVVVFSKSRRVLERLLPLVARELGRLRLRLKNNYQICMFDFKTRRAKMTKNFIIKRIRIGRPLDFMGFVFFREKTVIRKSILLRTTRLAKRMFKAKKRCGKYYAKNVRALVSAMGWFKHTDSYDCYLKYIKPHVNIRKLKRIISKLDKEANYNDQLENRTLFHTAA